MKLITDRHGVRWTLDRRFLVLRHVMQGASTKYLVIDSRDPHRAVYRARTIADAKETIRDCRRDREG